MTPAIALIALFLDVIFGWPDRWYRRIGHPVTWLGRLIGALEQQLNRGQARRLKGIATTLIAIAAAALPAILLQDLLGVWGAAILAWPLVAARSLHDHLRAVLHPLQRGDLTAARHATAMIVGRDVTQADQAALTRASLESLAENASDGVIAPLFWAMVAGLPGIAAYKAINTLDSMIGHKNARYHQFGWFAARLDDVANWLPARLTALLLALASGNPRSWRIARRDARAHRSPNAGWPEAAMAGALNVRLSGPRAYGDRTSAEPWLNEAAPDPQVADLDRGIGLYRRALWIAAVLLLTAAIA